MLSGTNIRSSCGRACPESLRGALVATMVLAGVSSGACDKSPLLAPTSSTISVSAPTRVLPLGGSTEITAYVIEQAGTPVQNGTTVRFVTNLGSVEPVEAQTHNGVATTTFHAGDTSGVAEVRAMSGAAGAGTSTATPSAGGTGGTATAGNVLQITVGAAAIDTVTVRANPSTVSANGGVVEVIATVLAAGGRPLPGITVTFTANRGTLSSTTAVTDANGDARVQLTTNADTQVSASAGGKSSAAAATITAQPGPSVTLTCATASAPTCASLNIGDVAVFTAARGATTSSIRSATLDFGDGSTALELGNLSSNVTASHQYTQTGTWRATLTATDVNGEQTTATQILLVQESASVTLALSLNGTKNIVTATATATGGTPLRYEWNFGGDATTPTLTTTTNTATATYNSAGTKTVTVIVRFTDGRTATTSAQITTQTP